MSYTPAPPQGQMGEKVRKSLRNGTVVEYEVMEVNHPCNDCINREMAARKHALEKKERDFDRSSSAQPQKGVRPEVLEAKAKQEKRLEFLKQLEKDAQMTARRRADTKQKELDEERRNMEAAQAQEAQRLAAERELKNQQKRDLAAQSAQRQREADEKRKSQRDPSLSRPNTADSGNFIGGKPTNAEDHEAKMKKRQELQKFWLDQIRQRKDRQQQEKADDTRFNHEPDLLGNSTRTRAAMTASLARMGQADDVAARKEKERQYREEVRKQILDNERRRQAAAQQDMDKSRADADVARKIAEDKLAREREQKEKTRQEMKAAMESNLRARSAHRPNSTFNGSRNGPAPDEKMYGGVLYRCPVDKHFYPAEDFNIPRNKQSTTTPREDVA